MLNSSATLLPTRLVDRSGGTRRTPMISPAKYVKLPLFESVTGYTEKAVRRKIEEGHWLEGGEYVRAPDGHILVNMEGYYKWVENPKRAA
jgi:hypothetical protein